MPEDSFPDPSPDKSGPSQPVTANLPAAATPAALTDQPAPVEGPGGEATASANALSRVQVSFDLAPGARISVMVQALPAENGSGPAAPLQTVYRVVSQTDRPPSAELAEPARAPSNQLAAPPSSFKAPAADQPGGRPAGPSPNAETTIAISAPGAQPDKAAPLPKLVRAVPVPDANDSFLLPDETPFAWPPFMLRAQQALAGRLRDVFQPGTWSQSLRAALDVRDQPLATTLFGLALVVYAVTRFVGLEQFPIYFFTDEAVQTVQAADFVRDGFRDYLGQYFPTYFQNGQFFNLSVSVYVQIIPYLLFGKSLFVTRGVSALISLFGTAAVGLILKNIFKVRWWWAGVMLLSITPVWFLHSRTAFETVIMASLYAWYLYFYLLYRYREPRYLFPALLFGALAFYSYKGGQLVIVLTSLILLISDLRYHWANRRLGWWGVAFLGLLLLPEFRFQIQRPEDTRLHLQILDSYWVKNLPLTEKLSRFWSEYTYGLSPAFWYIPDNHRDLPRHMMKGYGHIFMATLPLAVLGIVICLRRFKSSAYRTLLIATLVAPAGAAMAAIGATRGLVFVISAALLTALGLDAIARWASKRLPAAALAVGLFALLSLVNLNMLRDALVNGPTWYSDYGLGGMQYGARQVYAAIGAYLKQSPQASIVLSPSWTNGADVLQRFFMDNEPRVRLGSVDSYMDVKQDLNEETLFIMIPEEYQKALTSPKFTDIRLEQTLRYPNGADGFYFVRLRYAPDADAAFAAERQARQHLVAEQIRLDGQPVDVSFSALDSGRIQDVFDGDPFTLARTRESNPAIFELIFPAPRALTGVTVTLGSMNPRLTVHLYADENAEPVAYEQTYTGLPPDPVVDLAFNEGPTLVKKMRVEITNINEGESAKVHVREIALH